jgi:hypothetical protein
LLPTYAPVSIMMPMLQNAIDLNFTKSPTCMSILLSPTYHTANRPN